MASFTVLRAGVEEGRSQGLGTMAAFRWHGTREPLSRFRAW